MKLAIISDLHLEFSPWFWPEDMEDVDLVIDAGDCHPKKMMKDLLHGDIPHKVLYVPGNHDYYGGRWQQDNGFMEDHEQDGITFSGATLWTDANPAEYILLSNYLNDHRLIDGINHDAMNTRHKLHLNWLTKSEADVIVSHHGPSYRSASPKWHGSQVNSGFYSNLDEHIMNLKKPPKLWIHGHTHDEADYTIGNTRVICHPRGYPGEDNHHNYKPKVIEL